MYNPFSLEGKTILVTGASSGIGKATAIECSKMGATVIALGRNEDRLRDTFDQLESPGCLQFALDLTDSEAIQSLIPALPEIDGIANCAGIAYMTPFSFVSRQEFDKVFDINFFSPVLLVKMLLKAKKLKKGSSVVFVSSVDGPRIVHSGNSVYSASKNALVGMSRNMAIDLAPKKIRVNCVLPGSTDTPLIRTNNVTEEELLEYVKKSPLKRFGRPEEMAFGIIYLLSDASCFVTGTELVIDGGVSIV